MLRRVAVVRTDFSEEPSASFISVTRIGELGTTLAATSNLQTLRRNTKKRRFLQEPNGVTSQKTLFFIVTAVKTSNLTYPTTGRESPYDVESCRLSLFLDSRFTDGGLPKNIPAAQFG
jgi:hypothetical protein